MTIALDPEDAAKVSAAHSLSLITKTPRTHYVRVPHDRLTEPAVAAAARETLDRAVQRSWVGPRWQRGADSGGTPAKLVPTCPVHGYELSISGEGMGCDGKPPEL